MSVVADPDGSGIGVASWIVRCVSWRKIRRLPDGDGRSYGEPGAELLSRWRRNMFSVIERHRHQLSRHGPSIAALALAATAPVALAGSATAAPQSAPLTWTFDKCAVGTGAWQGTAHGPTGVAEPLQTQLTSSRQTDSVLQVEFDWHVGTTYLAQLSGILNLKTGTVVMNGQVTEGQYAGSQVHEEGQLYDPANSCFAGTIRVMPASG